MFKELKIYYNTYIYHTLISLILYTLYSILYRDNFCLYSYCHIRLLLSRGIDGEDEVGLLSKDLNIMVLSIRKLISEAYEADIQKNTLLLKQKEIRLKMLANQINSHFLFNTLESIRMRSISKGDKEIVGVVLEIGYNYGCS